MVSNIDLMYKKARSIESSGLLFLYNRLNLTVRLAVTVRISGRITAHKNIVNDHDRV